MSAAQDLQIIYRNPKDLVAYERNSRRHSPDQISKIRASLREFSFTNPILLRDDERTIGAGHARCQAALLEKLDRVPTITLRGLDETQWRAYVIADNQLAITGSSWDEGLLKMELADLQGAGFDLSLTGFTSLELGSIFSTLEGETDPEEVPEVQKVTVSQPGDLWLMEGHRLLCGDSTSKEDVERLLDGRKPHLMVTDQPFGVSYSPDWRSTEVPQVGKWKAPNRALGKVQNDDRAEWREAWALFPGDVIYVWHDGSNPAPTQLALEASGFEVRSQIIWRKTSMVVGRGHYHWSHESAFYAVRKTKNGHWAGDRKQTTVWDIEAPKRSETGHGTQKPVECMARPVKNNSSPGDLVYEPFSGSFTTGIACHMNKRICFAMEIDAAYVDVGVRRWQQFSGLEATLAETGETFEEVKARRSNAGEVL